MRITIASDFVSVSPLQFSLLRAALVQLVSETSDPAHANAVTAYRKVCSNKTAFSVQVATPPVCAALSTSAPQTQSFQCPFSSCCQSPCAAQVCAPMVTVATSEARTVPFAFTRTS